MILRKTLRKILRKIPSPPKWISVKEGLPSMELIATYEKGKDYATYDFYVWIDGEGSLMLSKLFMTTDRDDNPIKMWIYPEPQPCCCFEGNVFSVGAATHYALVKPPKKGRLE